MERLSLTFDKRCWGLYFNVKCTFSDAYKVVSVFYCIFALWIIYGLPNNKQ